MAPNKNGNGAGSKAASDKNKKGSSTAASNDEWMKEQTTNTTPKEDETNTKESSSSNSTTTSSTDTQNELHDYVWVAAAIFVLYKVLATAYDIRLTSIKEYGTVIHEYDPYFNYRATEYLYWNGYKKFFKWFDYLVWYPLGRPVGTTIYPGMQFTAVWIKDFLLQDWSLNDICCYIPAWFGAVATFMTGLLAYECSIPANTSSNIFTVLMDIVTGQRTETAGNTHTRTIFGLSSPAAECGLISAAMMAIVPAHLMRSMGGGYDNESIAVTAMVTTFYFWVRSLRATDPNSHWLGIITGLAYFYMVAAWGGYVFVLNLIGLHAAALVGMGRFSDKVYKAYTLFYIVGTVLAIQIPVVGWAPLKSLEQLGPAAVFAGYQLLALTEYLRKKQDLSRKQAWIMRVQFFGAAAVAVLAMAFLLAPTGFFGPISARVRGLFVMHTKTGNPLVDSVAEHQAASTSAYFQYLHHVCTLAPIGYTIVFFAWSDSSSFLIVWATAAYFFSHKMVRLILLTAPIGSILGGIAAGRIFAWCVNQWWSVDYTEALEASSGTNGSSAKKGGSKKGKKQSKYSSAPSSYDVFKSFQDSADTVLNTREGVLTKQTIALVVLLLGYFGGGSFTKYCWQLSETLSNPTIVQKARLRDGRVILLDDYRNAYNWLKDNTPEDSRVMAWWDYGYQIAGIANRTTIADGNTWNHEHIALLGKAFTTDLDTGYEISRHWADYVLIWGGGMGDDLGKSPHLARIANSVYRDHCPNDPTCRAFGFLDREMTPSAMMERSFLYRLHGHKIKPGVEAPADKFTEVFRSKYGKVRIFKILGVSEESKQWVADPANRVCDVPGSWFCPGQYPPGLSKLSSTKKDFQQLEDFNRERGDDDYQKQYFEDLFDPASAKRRHLLQEREQIKKEKKEINSEEELKKQEIKVDEIYNTFEDTEDTTLMWKLISTNAIEDLKAWLEAEPHKAFIRSKDGRGPMFWSFELRNEEATKLLMKAGVPHTDRDSSGKTPVDLLEGNK